MHKIYSHQYKLTSKTEISNRNGLPNGKRKIDDYILHDNLLYIALPLEHSKNVRYIKANLIPALGLKISKFTYVNEQTRQKYGAYEYYVDIADIKTGVDVWTLDDLYLDVLLWEHKRLEILDTDEFVEATKLGYLSNGQHARALQNLHNFVTKISLFEFDLDAYLASEGIRLIWK